MLRRICTDLARRTNPLISKLRNIPVVLLGLHNRVNNWSEQSVQQMIKPRVLLLVILDVCKILDECLSVHRR